MNLSMLPIPTARSLTRRRRHTQDARKQLATYQSRLTSSAPDAQAHRVMNLLWAKAFIDQALAEETRNHLGSPYATPAKIVGEPLTVGPRLVATHVRSADGRAVPATLKG